ncbi:hypothetical protein DFH08DRAFT_951049 [Mycena albidolilacea]|uniref:Cysteine protease n=1 Tax=Mycena albidolilacea TaxID=1033008 RepID=A0AAD7F2F3_9AGAR|nr:hypothetical protein DFH08DRAFT_951049 [Mycena albidolilacea]
MTLKKQPPARASALEDSLAPYQRPGGFDILQPAPPSATTDAGLHVCDNADADANRDRFKSLSVDGPPSAASSASHATSNSVSTSSPGGGGRWAAQRRALSRARPLSVHCGTVRPCTRSEHHFYASTLPSVSGHSSSSHSAGNDTLQLAYIEPPVRGRPACSKTARLVRAHREEHERSTARGGNQPHDVARLIRVRNVAPCVRPPRAQGRILLHVDVDISQGGFVILECHDTQGGVDCQLRLECGALKLLRRPPHAYASSTSHSHPPATSTLTSSSRGTKKWWPEGLDERRGVILVDAFPAYGLRVSVATDGTLYQAEVYAASRSPAVPSKALSCSGSRLSSSGHSQTSSAHPSGRKSVEKGDGKAKEGKEGWSARLVLLLLLDIRLGLEGVDPVSRGYQGEFHPSFFTHSLHIVASMCSFLSPPFFLLLPPYSSCAALRPSPPYIRHSPILIIPVLPSLATTLSSLLLLLCIAHLLTLLYTFPQSVGITGGRPSSSYYFIGAQGGGLFYFDPRLSRPRRVISLEHGYARGGLLSPEYGYRQAHAPGRGQTRGEGKRKLLGCTSVFGEQEIAG